MLLPTTCPPPPLPSLKHMESVRRSLRNTREEMMREWDEWRRSAPPSSDLPLALLPAELPLALLPVHSDYPQARCVCAACCCAPPS